MTSRRVPSANGDTERGVVPRRSMATTCCRDELAAVRRDFGGGPLRGSLVGGMPSRDKKPCMCSAGALRGSPASTRTRPLALWSGPALRSNRAAPAPMMTTSSSSFLVHDDQDDIETVAAGNSVAESGTGCLHGQVSASPRINAEFSQIAARLRHIRQKKNVTLADLAAATGISKSTLSRLESGQRKPSLELLLPIAAALAVLARRDRQLAARSKTRAWPQRPVRKEGACSHRSRSTRVSRRPSRSRSRATDRTPEPRTHAGYEWVFVLPGRLRLVLGEHDLVLGVGEAAEFDTRNPHWFGAAGTAEVEILSMFGKQGERMHLRARSKATST